MIEIKKFPTTSWKDYRNLRLDALKKDSISFSSSYEEEKKLSDSEWKRRTRNTLFAFYDDKPIGMIAYVFNKKRKIKHIANIFGFYVKENYRNHGVGKKLIESALSSIKKNKSVIKIDLTVNSKKKAAVKLYKKFEFKTVGVLKKDLLVNGNFYDELIMEKFL